ncbi:MAG: hypothetical protein NUV82_02665 [Candidatus Komeilibacteria bacterium]|nr:hypothetical protein [Candidatus Komeilibacteria bacterium]
MKLKYRYDLNLPYTIGICSVILIAIGLLGVENEYKLSYFFMVIALTGFIATANVHIKNIEARKMWRHYWARAVYVITSQNSETKVYVPFSDDIPLMFEEYSEMKHGKLLSALIIKLEKEISEKRSAVDVLREIPRGLQPIAVNGE